MTDITVSLSDPPHEWIEARAKAEHLGDAADYVRELISRDHERSEAVARMQTLIDEGFASGTSNRSMDDILEEAKALARAQA